MRILVILWFVLFSSNCFAITTPLDIVLNNKKPVTAYAHKKVVEVREELIKMVTKGVGGNDIPLLLRNSEIDSVRLTPMFIANMDTIDKDILAMYVQHKGKSMILLNNEILSYDDDEFTDIIVHEYVHEIDMLLGRRVVKDMGFKKDTIYSKYVSFHKTVLRTRLSNPTAYVTQIDDFIMLSSGLHSKDFFEFDKSAKAMLRDMMYVVSNIWINNEYYTSDMEVFTRYVLMKRWLVQHKQISDIYAPISKENMLFMIASFPLIHNKNSCFDKNIMKQNFYPLLFFFDMSKFGLEN